MSDRDRQGFKGAGTAAHDAESELSADDQLSDLRLRVARHKRMIQRKASREQGSGEARIPTGGGAPLSAEVRGRMEPLVGAGLSDVRVHAGGDSAVAAEQLGARAFTKGTDVHFGAGEFKPGTKEGDRLLAHELTHAAQAQQSGIQRKAVSGTDGAAQDADAAEHDVSMPGDPAEREADAVGDAAADALHGDKPASSGAAPQPPKAQLSGVGRKIHLSRKGEPQQQNDPAKASVKRLGRAGQDKTQLNDALKKVQHERDAATEELGVLQKQIGSFGLPKARATQAMTSIKTAINAMADHLSDADITGAMRDTAKDPVRKPGSGEEYDHLDEVQSSLRALKNTRDTLTQIRTDLVKRQTDPKILAEKLDPALNALTAVANSVSQALKKIKP